MVVMPFTYSIPDGIGAGFISYVVLKYVTGRGRDVHWMLLLSAVLFVVYFAIEPIRAALGI
jgi:AGZA family xanthine/uracil permease-like MFS transporter